MIIPYIYLWRVFFVRLEESLELIDGYEFPSGEQNESLATIESCCDDEDGTLDF